MICATATTAWYNRLTPTKEYQMNFKEELKFQRDQAVGIFDGFERFASEILILGAVGVVMVVCIFAVLGLITEMVKTLG